MRISLLVFAAATILITTSAARAQQSREDCWVDIKTGKGVRTAPFSGVNTGLAATLDAGTAEVSEDRQTARNRKTGQNYARVPCPPPPKTAEKPKQTATGAGSPQANGSIAPEFAVGPKRVGLDVNVASGTGFVNTPVNLDPLIRIIFDIHNGERAAVGAPPLHWNPALQASATAYAQQLARTGQLVHAPREGRGIERENLSQGMLGWGPEQMMRNWLREKQNFVAGTYPDVSRTGRWNDVSHYSQMIWPETTDLGCGMATGSGYQWLVCRYSPGGNKEGKPVGRPPLASAATAYQWIDVKTGKPVTSWPVITHNGKTYYVQASIGDPDRAFDPESGRNFARENGEWIDVKTGKPATSWPVITHNGKTYYVQASIGDPNRAYDPESGRNFAKKPVSATKAAPERGR